MRRRQALAALGAAVTTALAGCNSSTMNSPTATANESSSDVDTQAKFGVESGDIVVLHEGGDILQSGQTVYVTVGGETVSETTLGEDIHAGGEIIRVEDFNSDCGEVIIGLYMDEEDGPIEIDTGEIDMGACLNSPAPDAQIDFDYDSGASEVVITHQGGDTINPDNTGELSINGDFSTVEWETGSNSGTNADTTMVKDHVSAGSVIATVTGAEMVELVWSSPDGGSSQVIGTWEAP